MVQLSAIRERLWYSNPWLKRMLMPSDINVIGRQCDRASMWSDINVIGHPYDGASMWSSINVISINVIGHQFDRASMWSASMWSGINVIGHQCDRASMWSRNNVIGHQCDRRWRVTKKPPWACILEGYIIWHVWRLMVDEIARYSVIMKTKLYKCDWLLNPHSALPHISLINGSSGNR